MLSPPNEGKIEWSLYAFQAETKKPEGFLGSGGQRTMCMSILDNFPPLEG